MKELRQIIGENLTELRKKNKLTQAELADKLNYSDKSISKWEKGSTLPDIEMLYKLAEMYGVTIDYLVREGDQTEKKDYVIPKTSTYNKRIIASLATIVIWIVATLVFVYAKIIYAKNLWLLFLYALPVSCIVLLIFNSIWGNKRLNYVIISIGIWTFLLDIFLTFIKYSSVNIWPVFIIGIPLQITVILWSGIKKNPNKSHHGKSKKQKEITKTETSSSNTTNNNN